MPHTLGVIGYGGMGGWHAASVMEQIPELRVKGVYDVREEASAKARSKGLFAYASREAILSDPEIDLITIATPNNFHKEIALQALRAGKHVVCEKPVTLNAGDLEDVIAASEAAGRVFAVHQNRRWDRDYAIVREVLRSGVIGEPYFIESRVQGSRRFLHGWRAYQVDGGGMLYDWGVHLLDQIMMLIDSPLVSVEGHLQRVFSGEVDDNVKAYLRFENGVSAMIEVATNCFIAQPRWHICCKDGTCQIDDWDCGGRIVRLNTDAMMEWEDDIVYTSAGPTRTMAPRPKHTTEALPLPEVVADLSEYYRNICDAIEGRAELIVKPAQSLRVMRAIDAIFASDRARAGLGVHI